MAHITSTSNTEENACGSGWRNQIGIRYVTPASGRNHKEVRRGCVMPIHTKTTTK
jgi:hypothetical protein